MGQSQSDSAATELHLYEGTLSFRFEAEDDAEARKIAREMGDIAVQHPLAIDVAEEDVHRV